MIVWNSIGGEGVGVGEERVKGNSTTTTSTAARSPPPDPLVDYPWSLVPIRVRIETNNSLNNRYKPDDSLRFRAVLSLDDDLRVPCADIERGFAVWRISPNALTGFYPRLAEVSATPRYQGEPVAIEKSWYNLILTGAAFIDSRTAFARYWADSIAQARTFVDHVQNCDDLLMNFVVANATKGRRYPTVAFVRPSRRLDVSWWSGVGLSHASTHFREDAEACLRDFERIFGRWPLKAEQFDWRWGMSDGPDCRDKSALDCKYLA